MPFFLISHERVVPVTQRPKDKPTSHTREEEYFHDNEEELGPFQKLAQTFEE